MKKTLLSLAFLAALATMAGAAETKATEPLTDARLKEGVRLQVQLQLCDFDVYIADAYDTPAMETYGGGLLHGNAFPAHRGVRGEAAQTKACALTRLVQMRDGARLGVSLTPPKED